MVHQRNLLLENAFHFISYYATYADCQEDEEGKRKTRLIIEPVIRKVTKALVCICWGLCALTNRKECMWDVNF